MDKYKLDILSGCVERTIDYAKTIADPNISIGEKVFAHHCQGMNERGVVFQMNQLKTKKPSGTFKIGGTVHPYESFEMNMREQNDHRIPTSSTMGNPTITIQVEDLNVDLVEKIREALEKDDRCL